MRALVLSLCFGWSLGCSDMALMSAEYDMAGGEEAPPASPAADDDDGLGGETEVAFLGLRPAPTETHVFVANPSLNTATRISVPSLSVLTTGVGVHPAVALTTPDSRAAVIFNEGSDDISLIDAEAMTVRTVAVRPNFNEMVMSPDGAWVACFHAAAAEDSDDPVSSGSQSYGEVSFVRLGDEAHFPLVVGYNPRQVLFTPDGSRALVVSDDYLVVVDLRGDEPLRTALPITDGETDPPEAEEVVVDPAGVWALVRQYGASELVVVDIEALEVGRVPMAGSATDLDVTPDGQKAVAVSRSSSTLMIYDLSDPYAIPETVDLPPAEVLGSVVMSPDGSRGLLFSTQSGLSRYAVWDILTEDPEQRLTVHSVEKPVSSVNISPDGATALLFHDAANGVDVDSDSPFYNAYALTMISLHDLFPNTLRLAGEPEGFAQSEDGSMGFLILDGVAELDVLRYRDLMHDRVPLRSEAVFVGVLPGTETAFVTQEHDLGRISFYDTATEALNTVTGYELNAAIEK